eukprot:g5704.t2
MAVASEDVNRLVPPADDSRDISDIIATVGPSPATRVRKRTRAKRKVNSAVQGVSKPHVFDKEIFALALPTLGAVLIDPCLSLVDTGYVGRLGALSLAAVGPCAAAFNFVFVTASCALLVSTSVLVSEQRAMSNRDAIGRTVTLASGLALSVGAIIAGLFYVNSAGLLSLMGAPQEVMGLAVPYLRWRASAFPANLFLLVACGVFRGMGEPEAGLKNAIAVGTVNLVLDPVLMFGCGLGVAGAAIATAAAQWVGALVYASFMWNRREQLGLAKGLSIPGWSEVKQFLGSGGAMVFRQLCNVGAWTVMASAATRMGILEVAAHQLMLSLWLVIAFVQESLGSSGQVLVAQYLGLARDNRKGLDPKAPWVGDALECRKTARSIAKRVLTLSMGLGFGLAACSRVMFPVLLVVVCQSKEVAALVSQAFPTILYAFPMCCVVWTWDSLFYGASDFVYNAKAVAVASLCGVTGSILSLKRGWGILGLWTSMTYLLFGAEASVMSTTDGELKTSLLESFCPILRFDAAEKHFPVRTETFISCSLLLRRPKNTRQARKETRRRRKARQAEQQQQNQDDEDDDDDDDEDDDEDDADAGGGTEEGNRHQQQQQACVRCGKREGWCIPSKGGWELVALPAGSDSWSVSSLLGEQRRDRVHEFRLEPHCCIWGGEPRDLSTVPCYAFAELLDPSAMAPFIGRAGLGPVYELKYAFLYGYNGTTFAIPGTSVGVHTGDLEHVTIRVDARRRIILEAFFAAHSTGRSLGGSGAPRAYLRVGERLVIYPARNGHASYHQPKRWRRFAGLGDDVCGGDGVVWRPSPVQLEHPKGRSPAWLKFRGRYGSTRDIASEGFWKVRGEALRRCSAEAKYRSLLEEGLVPDRGVRLGPSRRILHGNGDRGVWLERHRQTQNRMPLVNMWTRVPGVSSSRPQDQDPPRSPDLVWLADWGFLRDVSGGTTDAEGWSYHSSQGEYADTGISGKSKNSGLLVHRCRGRVWFRVAATPQVAEEVEEAHRQNGGRHPRGVLALAALDVAGRGGTVTSASVLHTLGDGVDRHGAGASSGAQEVKPSSTIAYGAAGDGRGALCASSPMELAVARSPEELHMSFGSVAKRSMGGS